MFGSDKTITCLHCGETSLAAALVPSSTAQHATDVGTAFAVLAQIIRESSSPSRPQLAAALVTIEGGLEIVLGDVTANDRRLVELQCDLMRVFEKTRAELSKINAVKKQGNTPATRPVIGKVSL